MLIKKQLRNRTKKKIPERKMIKLRQGVNVYFLKFKKIQQTPEGELISIPRVL